MHILITANAAWNIWNFRKALIESLIKNKHRVTIFAPWDESAVQIKEMGCEFKTLEMNAKGLNPLDGLVIIRQFKRILKNDRPDVILSYTIKNNIFGAIAAKPLHIPFLPNVTGLGTAFLSGGLLEKIAEVLYRFAFKNVPIIFFQNEDDQALFTGRNLIKQNQARLLPGSGIDLQEFSAKPLPISDSPKFLMIARLLKDKGIVEYVEAAKKIKASNPNVRFQLLGAIGTQNRTAIGIETVQEWVKSGTIEYLGTTTDVRPFIEQASCVVLPSYREGAPRTLIEAAAMARPIVTTDVPGCRAVVKSGDNGFLCDVRDSVSLAKAMKRFLELEHPEKEALGQAGRLKMELEFDQKIIVDAYLSAIKTLTITDT